MSAGHSGKVAGVPNRQTRRSVEVYYFNNSCYINLNSTLKMGRNLSLNVGGCVEIILTLQGYKLIIQSAYKLPEDFAKPYFHKY